MDQLTLPRNKNHSGGDPFLYIHRKLIVNYFQVNKLIFILYIPKFCIRYYLHLDTSKKLAKKLMYWLTGVFVCKISLCLSTYAISYIKGKRSQLVFINFFNLPRLEENVNNKFLLKEMDY